MAYYRVYIVHRDREIARQAEVECASDHEACALAESLLDPGGQAEVWSGSRFVRLVYVHKVLSGPRPPD